MKQRTFPLATSAGTDGATIACFVLDGDDDADRAWIETEAGLEATVSKVVASSPRSNRRLHRGASALLCLRHPDRGNNRDRIGGVNLLIEPARIVAVVFGAAGPVGQALERFLNRDAPADQAAGVMSRLVMALVAPVEAETTRLADRIDELEDKAMSEDDEGLDDRAVAVGRRALALRRFLTPLRDELAFQAFSPDDVPAGADPRELRRTEQYLGQLVGALDTSHQRVSLVLNQLRNRDENRLSRAMHKLTIVATVFLPLTFVTGLLGINVAGIPDAHDPMAFWLVCAFLAGIAVAAFAMLRWKKWM